MIENFFLEDPMAHSPEENSRKEWSKITRRGFLKSMGVGALAVGSTGGLLHEPSHAAEQVVVNADETVRIELFINRRRYSLLVEPRWSLLYVIREQLGLMGTKVGCERGECGACTVLIDDTPRYACMTLALECEGCEIQTVEGLMKGDQLGAVQQAFVEHDALQCGYCTSGQIMAVEGLLRANPKPSPDEIRAGVSGNLCRCGAYTHIFNAAQRAVELKERGEVSGDARS